MTKQLLKPQLAQSQEMELMPHMLLRQTKDANQAVKFMLGISGVTQEAMGEAIGKPRETVSRFANGNGGLTANEIEMLINESGNAFFLQYLAEKFGFELKRKDEKQRQIEELERQLDEVRRAA